jgi:hypothetical protein
MRSIAIFLCLAFIKLVIAQQGNATGNATAPASSGTSSSTMMPTTTIPPTRSPTRAPIPAPVPDRACYSNLTEIDDKNKFKSPFVVETFVLCPDTVYPIGEFGPSNVVVDGYVPLRPRSNTIYSCGEDGKSSNNCTFSGGIYQVSHMFTTYNNENKVGVVLKGITFEKAIETSLLLVAPGDITFIDCVFSVSTFVFAIYHGYNFTDGSTLYYSSL